MKTSFLRSRFLARFSGVALVVVGLAGCPDVARAQAAKGELLLAEDFQRHAVYTKERLPVRDGWQVRVAHGRWTRTSEGVESAWETGHSPVLVYEGEFQDVIVEVEFRFRREEGKWAAFRLSTANPTLDPRAYAASVWANVDFASRARGFVLENDQWSGHITRVGYSRAEFAPDVWHTVRLESVGATTTAVCGPFRVQGTHPKFGLPKTSIWLGTGQSRHELRHLRVYRALPSPAAPAGSPAPAAAPSRR